VLVIGTAHLVISAKYVESEPNREQLHGLSVECILSQLSSVRIVRFLRLHGFAITQFARIMNIVRCSRLSCRIPISVVCGCDKAVYFSAHYL